MFKKIFTVFMLICTVSQAEPFIDLYGGMGWPKTLSNLAVSGDHVMGNVGIEGGRMFGGVFGLGGVVEFSFKGTQKEKIEEVNSDSTGWSEITSQDRSLRRRLISTGIGARISPLKDARFRPVLRGSFLPSCMILINDYDTTDRDEILPPTGAYWGLTGNVGGDINVMITDEVSFYLGGGYRFGSVKKRLNYEFGQDVLNREYLRQPLQGGTIRAGFMVWMM